MFCLVILQGVSGGIIWKTPCHFERAPFKGSADARRRSARLGLPSVAGEPSDIEHRNVVLGQIVVELIRYVVRQPYQGNPVLDEILSS